MKIKSDISVKTLLKKINSGIISQQVYLDLIEKAKIADLGNHLEWTFDEYCQICESQNDVDIVKFLLERHKKTLPLLKRLTFNPNVLNLKAKNYLEIIKFAKYGIADIEIAMSQIKQPPMSKDMIQAGFKSLDFGTVGIARTVGSFEGIGTLQAFDLQIHLIIRSLSNMAQIKICEHDHTEILRLKNKT